MIYWSKYHRIVFLFLLSYFHHETSLLPQNFQETHWESLSNFLPFTTPESLKYKWLSFTHNKKHAFTNTWTFKEDNILNELVEKMAPGLLDPIKSKDIMMKWSAIAMKLNYLSKGNKLGKHCKERWLNHLSPLLNKDDWNEAEDIILLETAMQLKKKWTKVAGNFPGRTQHQVKNRFLSLIARENGVFTKAISLKESCDNLLILKAICNLKKRFHFQKKKKEVLSIEEEKFDDFSLKETYFTNFEEMESEDQRNLMIEEKENDDTFIWKILEENRNECQEMMIEENVENFQPVDFFFMTDL